MHLRLSAVFAAAALLFSLIGCSRNAVEDPFVTTVRRLHPSVVLLTMRVPPENRKDKFDEGYASGVVIASGAWGSDILTVQHAVDGAWNLHVTVGNKQKFPAKVIAQNADLDVALLRTDRPNLPVAPLGSSKHLADEVGRQLGVLGYPVPDDFEDDDLGLATSLNVGRLSSVRKDALEVTVPIVPGESGGPVFVAETGEIVGIAESRFDDERSIGFALPIDEAKKFLHKFDAVHGF
ncbi:MAG TPA: S1C family serine protease [Candidatus Acidoferrales bacterium]|jgi:S1-C subfamily serine protease|nr:S1C family serine protease [Candidatus Acidoferrales bacterium]